MKAILPVAGNGTRMYPLGITTPKALLPILNKPLILWSIEALQKNGVEEVIVVINSGEFGEQIKNYFNATPIHGIKLQFAVQDKQLGTAHVVQMAKDFFEPNEEFLYINGDDLYGPKNIEQVMHTKGLAVTGMKVKDPEKWGIFQVNPEGNLVHVFEKPSEHVGDLAAIHCMKLDARVFTLFDQLTPTSRGELEITDTLNLLATQSPIKVLTSNDYWLPIGYPWHILEAAEALLPKIHSQIDGIVEANVTINGNVVLPKSSTIKSGSYIEGNVVIGENTTIGPNAYVRGNVAIGDDCKVGFGVELKSSVIGNNTKIPHLSYVGDSILGKAVNFAVGSVTSNWRHDKKNIFTPVKAQMIDTGREKFGAVIGDNVMLGANTLIYPGRKIWPGKTTLPGQVVDKDIQ